MKKNKSKSNLRLNEKQNDKYVAMMKKLKNQKNQKSTTNLGNQLKKKQTNPVFHQKTSNMHSKTKSYLEKMLIVLPQQNLKSQLQSQFSSLRRKSATAIPERSDSRMSKRTSLVSNKSSKNKKAQNLKENDKNLNNLQKVEEQQNQSIGTTQKKITNKIQTKKKSSLNLNKKTSIQLKNSDLLKKDSQKSKNLKDFQNKMSRYLDSKNIFSRKASQQKLNHTKQSKQSKNFSSQKVSQKKLIFEPQNLSGKMINKERQNLLQIYQFYKKTFDINFDNCLKRSKNQTKREKNSQNSSKSALKPFYSSNIIQKRQKSFQNKQFQEKTLTNSKTKIQVSGVLNDNDSLKKPKRNGSVVVCNKQNEYRFQKSSFHNSKSKSLINSDSSTKDNLFYWKVDCQNTQKGKLQEGRKIRKSFKELIVFRQKFGSNCKQDERKEQQKIESTNQYEIVQIQMNKILIGSSNIQLLKWSNSEKKGLNSHLKNDIGNKVNEYEQQIQKEEPQLLQGKNQISPKKLIIKRIDIAPIQQQLDVTKLIKKYSKQNQIGNLDDLSSISLYQEQKNCIYQNQFSNQSKRKSPTILKIDDIDFQF